MEIHEKIRFIRMFKGFSQEEMAEKVGMAVNGYAKIERGEVDINLSRLQQIAKMLGVELAQLVELNEKSVFNFIENSHNFIQSNFGNVELQYQYELEKARLVIEQKDKEIACLREMIELMKKQT